MHTGCENFYRATIVTVANKITAPNMFIGYRVLGVPHNKRNREQKIRISIYQKSCIVEYTVSDKPLIFSTHLGSRIHKVDSKVSLLKLLKRIGSAHMVSYLTFWNSVELTLLLGVEFWNVSLENHKRPYGILCCQFLRLKLKPKHKPGIKRGAQTLA